MPFTLAILLTSLPVKTVPHPKNSAKVTIIVPAIIFDVKPEDLSLIFCIPATLFNYYCLKKTRPKGAYSYMVLLRLV